MAHDAHDAPYDADLGRPSPTENHASPPAESLVAGTVGDRCVNCAAPLSSDQRYCVVCGERRGAPRFSLPPASSAAASSSDAPARSRPRGPRFGQGPTLIAGVATLLLAMLVGVLIGHGIGSHGTQTVASAPVRIITTGGGTSAPAASASSAGAAASGASKAGKARAKAKPKAAPKVTRKAAKAESNAASKVLGGKSTPPPTVTVGAKGTGKGYSKKTHKFTGSFFGQ